jgi:hypothetical protein
MYVSWRRQLALEAAQESPKQRKRLAAKVAREVMFYRAGYGASIPEWAQPIADDRSIPIKDVRAALFKALTQPKPTITFFEWVWIWLETEEEKERVKREFRTDGDF